MKNKVEVNVQLRLLLIPFAALLMGCPVPHTPTTPVGQWNLSDPVTGSTYWVYVPKKYSEQKPMPVIVSCHGTVPFDVAEHHIRTWKWYGEKYGCIILCPDLVGTDGIFGDGPVLGMLDNERRILSILSTLSYRYNIDRANIMITGFSGGGFAVYWVGLRHPDVFSVVAAQGGNFSRSNLDGWYPRSATNTPVFIYYGENELGTIVVQSKRAIQYLRNNGFRKLKTMIIPGVGHDRRPDIGMEFFRKNWKTPSPTILHNSRSKNARSGDRTSNSGGFRPQGPRPPAP